MVLITKHANYRHHPGLQINNIIDLRQSVAYLRPIPCSPERIPPRENQVRIRVQSGFRTVMAVWNEPGTDPYTWAARVTEGSSSRKRRTSSHAAAWRVLLPGGGKSGGYFGATGFSSFAAVGLSSFAGTNFRPPPLMQ